MKMTENWKQDGYTCVVKDCARDAVRLATAGPSSFNPGPIIMPMCDDHATQLADSSSPEMTHDCLGCGLRQPVN